MIEAVQNFCSGIKEQNTKIIMCNILLVTAASYCTNNLLHFCFNFILCKERIVKLIVYKEMTSHWAELSEA